ncbi:MAG: Ig domain-containing protein, partial [Muribaculaceae bacterium]|nr:Ig domain-containing protein [Muribaculaceae bacterium]
KGDVYNLTATVSPEDAADKTVTWESSNTNVATVENGKITAVGVGSATITAKSGKVQAKCIVTVNPVEVTAITLSQTLVRLTQGKTYNLIATIAPSNATDKTVTWESSNTNVATVENGKIIAVGVGSATITAKSGNVQAVCTVRVKSLDGKPLPGGSEGTGEIEW